MRRSLLAVALLSLSLSALAAETTPIKISAKDGKFTPDSVEVTAGQPFVLEVTNEGTKAIEFESKSLRQEKVVHPARPSA